MDLQTLHFKVETTDLDVAAKKIGVLTTAVEGLNKANNESVTVSKKAVDTAIALSTAQEKTAKAAKKTADATGETAAKMTPLDKLLTKLNNQYGDLVNGFTKGEAAILNQARAAGAAGDALKPFVNVLQKIKELTKDPFDASIGSLRNITQEFDKMTQRADLAARGIQLTTKQLQEYSKISAEVKGKVSEMGLDPTNGKGLQVYNKLLRETQADYIMVANAVNKFTAEEKEKNVVLRQSGAAASDSAKALAWIERELARAENALKGFNEELKTSTSNRLFKFEEQLKKAGITGAEAQNMMNQYRQTIIQGQKETNAQMDKELRNLARAVSVQMGDVAVSLASGMNPFMIMIQQGDQLRAAFQQVDASADQVRKSMGTAAAMIATSFIDVGKAIGSFFVGALASAGKQIMGLVTGPIVALTKGLKDVATTGFQTGSILETLGSVGKAVSASFTAALPTLIFAAVSAALALAKAFWDVSKSTDELTKNLLLTGGSLGLNRDGAIELAKTMEGLGVSTSKSVDLISAFAKEGGFLRSEMQTLIPVGAKLMETFGMTGEEVAKLFAKIKKDPVDALYDLAKSMGTVNIAVIQFVEEQMRVGNVLGATEAALKEAARVNSEAAESMKRDYSTLGRIINETGIFFKNFWSGVKGLVYEPTAMEKMQKELSDVNERVREVKENIAANAKWGIKADPKLLNQLERQAEVLRENIALSNKQIGVQQQQKESNAQAADAMKKLNDGYEKALDFRQKYAQEEQRINNLVQNAGNTAKAQELGQALLTKAKKEYTEALKKEQAELDKLTPAQKLYNSFIKQMTSISNESKASTENLTKANKEYLDLIKNPDYNKLSSVQKESLRLEFEKADAIERRAKLEADLMKGSLELAQQQAAIEKQQYNNTLNALNASKEKNIVMQEEARLLGLRITLLGQDNMASQQKLAELKARIAYEKELRDIENGNLARGSTSVDILKTEALDRYKAAVRNANTEIALDLANKLSQSLDSDSFSKSADRFAESLKAAGNVSFANVITSLSKVSESFSEIVEQQKVFNELREAAGNDQLKLAAITAKQRKAEIKSYGDLIGAAKGFFKQGSSGYKALHKAEQAFRAAEMVMAVVSAKTQIAENAKVVASTLWGYAQTAAGAISSAATIVSAKMSEGFASAVAAVANQGSGDPYTAFPRIAAMIAIMAGLGFMVGGGGGKGSGSSAGSSKETLKVSGSGVGTVFGDRDAKSESIANSLELLEDVNTLTMKYSAAMLQSLRSIDAKIGGVTNLILRANTNGISTNLGVSEGKGVNFGAMALGGGLFGAAAYQLGKAVPFLGKINEALFGKKTEITGEGIYVNPTALNNLDALNAGYYSNVKTTKKAFGIKYSSKSSTVQNASSELSQQFGLILSSFVDSVKLAGQALKVPLTDIDARLNSFVIEIGNIDLKGLKGEEIQEKLNAVFGAAGDTIAMAVLPGLEKFQEVGEGYFETAVRVANSFETVVSWFDTLGYSVSSINLDQAMDLVEIFGGLENFTESITSFYDNFYTEQEKLDKITQQLTHAFADLGVTMPTSKLEYRALVEAALAEGNNELVHSLLQLSDAFAQITPDVEEAIELVSDTLRELQEENQNLQIELLRTMGKTAEADAAFRALATQGMNDVEIAAWDANRALENQIQAIKDQTKAAEDALREQERIAQEALQKQNQIANERYGLETQLLQAQGDTAALRERELAALDPSNRELKKQIWALEDQKKAAEEAARLQEEANRAAEEAANALAQEAQRAADEAAQAAERIREAWQSVTDAIIDEVKRIRNIVFGTGGAQSFQTAKQAFDAAAARARAGDQEAAKALPELSQNMLELAETQSKSLYELRKIQLQTSITLESIANRFAANYGLTLPAFASGGSYAGGLALVGEQGPELINFNSPGQVYNSSQTASMLNSGSVVEAIDRLNSNIEMLRIEVRANVTHSAKTAKILDRVVTDGQTVSVRFLEPQQVQTV